MATANLKWRKSGSGWSAWTPFGSYDAEQEYRGCWTVYAFGSLMKQCKNKDEFKEMCKDDFYHRVMQSLDIIHG